MNTKQGLSEIEIWAMIIEKELDTSQWMAPSDI